MPMVAFKKATFNLKYLRGFQVEYLQGKDENKWEVRAYTKGGNPYGTTLGAFETEAEALEYKAEIDNRIGARGFLYDLEPDRGE